MKSSWGTVLNEFNQIPGTVTYKASGAETLANDESHVRVLRLHFDQKRVQISHPKGDMFVAVRFQVRGRMATVFGQRSGTFHLEQLEAQVAFLQHCCVGSCRFYIEALFEFESQHAPVPLDGPIETGDADSAMMKSELCHPFSF
jgi:hypothetical protein